MNKISPIVLTALPLFLIGSGIAWVYITFMQGFKGHYNYLEKTLEIWPLLLFLLILLYLIVLHYTSIKKSITGKKYWVMEGGVSFLLLLIVALSFLYLKNPSATVIVPDNFRGEAAIIYGIVGAPKLPKRRIISGKIILPENGILMTSAMSWEAPIFKKIKYKNGNQLKNIKIQKSTTYTCSSSKKVHYASFMIKERESELEKKVLEICSDLASGRLQTTYKR